MEIFSRNTTLICAFLAVLGLASCTTEDRKEEGTKQEIKVGILPPAVPFTVIKNKLGKVDWARHVDREHLKPKPGLIGFQIGLKLPNLVVAYFTKDEKVRNDISQNLFELGKAIDIDDEAVLLKMKEKLKSIDALVRDEKDQSYGDLLQEVSGLEHLVKNYFKGRGNDLVVQEIFFASWLEFLRISVSGFLTEYDEAQTGVFNRSTEVTYFRQRLGQKEFQKEFKDELEFLKKAGDTLGQAPGKTLSKKQLEDFLLEVNKLRSRYKA